MTGTSFTRNVKRRAKESRPLADFVDPCIAPALAKYGFGEADIITCWPDIVGERIASYAEPIRLQWGRRTAGRDGGAEPKRATLIVRVEGGGALELQHMAATLIERLNGHLGWACIGRLALRQAPLIGRPEPKRRPPPPAAAAIATARMAAEAIGDDGLREALVRLGARVLDRPR